ncbi:MAG: fimbrillin family protein [Rikenellaceae bacterium]
MKKLFLFFTFLLLVASCHKDTFITINGEKVTFTATVVEAETKASLKSTWKDGDEVALFVNGDVNGDDSKIYRYSVAENGAMTLQGDNEDFVIKVGDDVTYTAYYPYDETLTTLSEYEACCSAGEIDYMKVVAVSSEKEVTLQFEHRLAALCFDFAVNGTIIDPEVYLALDGDLDNPITLDLTEYEGTVVSNMLVNYFVESGTELNGALIKIEHSESFVFINSLYLEEGYSIENGKYYSFSYTIEGMSLGSGTEEDPSMIYTVDHLRALATGESDLSLYYKLANDIDFKEEEFTPIGTSSAKFTGTLDGDGQYSRLCFRSYVY